MFTAVTGDSRGYAFVEFTHERSCQEAYRVRYINICLVLYTYIHLAIFHIVCIQDDN